MSKKYSYRIEKRKETGFVLSALSILVSLIVSLAVTAGVIYLSGAEPGVVLLAIARGSFGNLSAIIDTLIKSTPIMITGLATIIAFRARVWNIVN